MTASSIDAVVFDFGGVLTAPVGDSIRSWLESDGIIPASFTRVLRAWMSRDVAHGSPVHLLETGELPAAEFEAILAAELDTYTGDPVQPAGLLSRLFAGMRTDEAMFGLVDDLRVAGVRVALLSNSWGNTYPHGRLAALLDPIVISGDVGLRKPHAPIYELTLDRLGVSADRALFLDDAEPNVLGARAIGMQAHLHTDASSTRAVIAALVPDLNPTATGAHA